jgi:hypothetical protein
LLCDQKNAPEGMAPVSLVVDSYIGNDFSGAKKSYHYLAVQDNICWLYALEYIFLITQQKKSHSQVENSLRNN